MRIDPEFKNLIPPLTAEEFQGLEQSILKDGCRDALVVWNDILIDGHNRYEICMKYGLPFKTIDMEFDSREDAKLWMMQNQLARRNLHPYVRTSMALTLKRAIADKAKKNLITHTETGYQGLQNSAKAVDTRKEIAKIAGVSHDTVTKVEKIESKASEEMKRQLKSGEMSINQAYQTIRRAEKEAAREADRQENAAKIETLHSPLEAQGLFQTIVIDPPWDWSDEGDVNQFGRAKPDYHTMTIDEIERLPIGQIADDNCHLYLWVTNRSLPKAFRLISAWGFRYVTCITWVKPSIGVGNYFRGSTEQILFAIKGSQQLRRHDVGTHFNAPRGKGHSAKPEEFYSIVESCSYGPYIDIFGRRERDGWSVWGENG